MLSRIIFPDSVKNRFCASIKQAAANKHCQIVLQEDVANQTPKQVS